MSAEGNVHYFRHRNPESTFDASAHEWLVMFGHLSYFFVNKDSDRPSPYDRLDAFKAVPTEEVPVAVRRRATARWGGFCRQAKRRGT